MNSSKLRIYLTGVGGQGTLTATTLLARVVMEQGLAVTSGEIHGMAQRGGVVESTVLIGGWQSPKICFGEADVILGFEALETMRALPYLAKNGVVLSSTEFMSPPGVSMGRESLPPVEDIKAEVAKLTDRSWFLPAQSLGLQVGSAQAGNVSMLAALCATGVMPFGPDALRDGIKKFLAPKLQESNLKAVDLGVAAVGK